MLFRSTGTFTRSTVEVAVYGATSVILRDGVVERVNVPVPVVQATGETAATTTTP